MEQLMGWRHWKLPHEDYSADGLELDIFCRILTTASCLSNLDFRFLATASPFITYLFTHTEKGGVKG